MKVLKMTVPICHFAQFARPLHYRITALHHQAWKKELLRPPPSPLSSAVQTLSLVSKHVNICDMYILIYILHTYIYICVYILFKCIYLLLLRPTPSPLSPTVRTLSLVSKHVNICDLYLHIGIYLFFTFSPWSDI
jgi:hypothetical protein